jgi:hypothetical protein
MGLATHACIPNAYALRPPEGQVLLSHHHWYGRFWTAAAVHGVISTCRVPFAVLTFVWRHGVGCGSGSEDAECNRAYVRDKTHSSSYFQAERRARIHGER